MYTIILCICLNFIKYSISGSNRYHLHYQWQLRFVPWDTKDHLVSTSQCFYFFQGKNIKRVGPRGTKADWVDSQQKFYWLQGNNRKRVVPRSTKYHWVNLLQYFTICNKIFSRQLAQGSLRPTGFILNLKKNLNK